MSHQSYETIDWNAEAIRVARAFGVEPKYGFEQINDEFYKVVYFNESVRFVAEYDDYMRSYFAQNRRDYHGQYSAIAFKWDDTIERAVAGKLEYSQLLARALFHLDLLTPEVEAALQVTISAHEKLEWLAEYRERYGEVVV